MADFYFIFLSVTIILCVKIIIYKCDQMDYVQEEYNGIIIHYLYIAWHYNFWLYL